MRLVVPPISFQTVAVAHIITIFFVELVVGYALERLPPEYQCFLDRKTDAFQE